MVRIGIDVRKIDDYGIGTHIRNVVLPAASLAANHQYFLYHDPLLPAAAQTEPFTWVPEDSGKYSIWEHIAIPRKAKAAGLELFHSPHYTLPLFLNVPSIVTIHDLIHFKFQRYFPAWKVQAAKFIIKKAVQKARVVIAVSETTRNDLLNWMPDLESKTRVIYNRLTEDWFEPSLELDIQSLGIHSDFVLYVGNFKKHKRIDILLDAFRNRPGFPQLVLVGHGQQADHDLTSEFLSMPNVRLLGFARPPLIRALYKKAILFVFPSEYEGFGYPPLEAMAAGCPVLSSDAPAMKEVLGSAAEFFQSGNAEDFRAKLERLLADSGVRKSFSEAGIHRARGFAKDESARQLVAEWNRVLAERAENRK